LKSTLSFNLGRILALCGIKTLLVGLEVQGTVSNNLMQDSEMESFDDIKDIKNLNGLYEASKSKPDGGCEIEKTIHSTDLPSLFFIPESSNLNHLEEKIRNQSRREHYLERLIEPLRDYFDVIIFDNSPTWSFLVQNSLVASNNVITPIACDLETYRSLTENIEMINQFKKTMEISWDNFILIPTKLERTKISTQIEAQYRTLFPNLITSSSIRAAVQGQASSLVKLSAIEHEPKSPLADDYFEVIKDIWERINPSSNDITNSLSDVENT